MTEKLPFDISVISQVLGIPYGKFYRWIKDNISDYRKEKTQEKLHEHDILVDEYYSKKTIKVPIFRQEEIGESMAIDEKHLNGKFHTVLTNSKTGKVALFCSSIQPINLDKCFDKFEKLDTIKFITRDLSPTFEKVAKTNFPNAIHIADKFHVIRHAIDAVQSMRIRLKQKALKEQRKLEEIHEQNYKDKKNPKFIGPKMNISKKYKPKRIENGETIPELLTRSRYLCAIHAQNWSQHQIKRASLLFKHFPKLEEVYDVILKFRDWYKVQPAYYEPFINDKSLGNWLDDAEDTNILELKNFRKLVENHFDEILNYHKCSHKTNAIAESVNSKIKEANRKNRGTRDEDFFNLRLSYII